MFYTIHLLTMLISHNLDLRYDQYIYIYIYIYIYKARNIVYIFDNWLSLSMASWTRAWKSLLVVMPVIGGSNPTCGTIGGGGLDPVMKLVRFSLLNILYIVYSKFI